MAESKKTTNKTDSKSKGVKELYVSAEATAKSSDKVEAKKSSTKNVIPLKILVSPLVTEKASRMSAQDKYVFRVSTDANKIEVAKVIEAVYGIKPEKVNVINMEGKAVRRGKISGKRKDWRKAIVTLPKGKTISIHEGV